MRTSLTASRDLKLQSQSWTVTGGRPLFDLSDAPQPGWYLFATSLDAVAGKTTEAEQPCGVALQFLPASGTVPLARRPIPRVGGRHGRVVYVPPGTARVRLEVSPWLETFSIGTPSFQRLPSALAASLMSADLAASSAFGSTDPRGVLSDAKAAHASGGGRATIEQLAVSYEHLQHRRAGDSVDYPSWRMRHAVLFDDDVERLRMKLAELPGGGPSFSVIVPVFNTDERWLRAAIESVRKQTYEQWQLVLVDDASTLPHVRTILDDYASLDPRIVVHKRESNGHIAMATNDGLEVSTGEFVAFMDHDDELAPFALAVIALSAAEADVLFTDEDKIDATGRHFDPHCKPPWNPELLLGQNYMSHLTAIRRSTIDAVGGLRTGFDGSQDHDLLLRVTEMVPADRIVRVPYVAYHWRAIAGSTARAADEKGYTETASIGALTDRLGPSWSVEPAAAPNAFRCTPPMLDYPLVSIVIPTRDRRDLLEQCITSLARTTYPAVEIIVVDNDSTDPETLNWFEAFDNGHDHRVVRHPGKFNYAAVNNSAVKQTHGEVLCLLNNDTEVIEPGWLDEMVRWIQQPDVGAVGAKLLYGDNRMQHAGVLIGLGGLAGHGHHLLDRDEFGYFSRLTIAHEVAAVTGACLVTRRSTWEKLGGLDEKLAVAFNDVDYCLRVRHDAGERIVWTPHALLHHHESLSRGAEDDLMKVARFNAEVDRVMTRWQHVLADDPAYSPNLSLDADSFTLARVPRVTPPWQEEPTST